MFEIIIDGLIGEIINSGIVTSKDTIKTFIKQRQHKNVHTEIYQVIVNALNHITCNAYKNNQDKIFEATAALLRLFKDVEGDKIEKIKSCLQDICLDVDNYTCLWFEDLLYREICEKDNVELYHEILLRLLKQENKYNHAELVQIKQGLSEIKQVLDGVGKEIESTKFKNNKKQDYIKNWNSRLFLHKDNNERPITLADAFIMPDFDYSIKSNVNNLVVV